MSGPQSSSPSEFRHGWKPLFAAFVGAACGINAIPFYTHGVFVVPVSQEFGWSRGATQFAFSFVMMGALLLAPVIGGIVDRFGARRIGIPSVIATGVGFALISFTGTTIWSYYALWILMTVIGTGTNPVTWTRVVAQWFERHRGFALGITMAGTGVVGTFAPRIAAWGIENYGWRGAYQLLGLGLVVIGLPVLYFFFRDRPAAPTTTQHVATSDSNALGVTLNDALKDYRFWALGVSMLLICGCVAGLITNLVPMLTDKGLDRGTAAGYASLVGISVIVGRVIAGYLIDILWAPAVGFVFLIAPAVTCVLLAGEVSPGILIFIVPLIGLAAGAELDMLSYLTTRYFGMKNYGAIYGVQYGFFAVGSGFAPAIFGAVFDSFGGYAPILWISAGCFVFGSLLLLALGRYPTFEPAKA